MERPDLEQLLARVLLEPPREERVVLASRRLRQTGIGDFANEDVLELVRLLATDRRAVLADDEVAKEQLLERRVRILELRREEDDRARPEEATDDRGALQQRP